jgi:two-component system sensor histidine kinase AgrC
VALLIFVNVELLRSRVIVDKQKSIIDSYNKYLPIVDELIEQVRGRQHGYDNNLQSIRALAVSCDDYDSLRTELLKNIDVMSHSDLPVFLLKFNLKLLSGLLFQKYCLATKQDIHIDFTINNYNIQSTVPEYVLVEAVGILMDNAIEASNKNDTIFVTIDCVENKFHFHIRNIGPTFTSDFFHKIFKRGYTTKSSTGRNHGIGLNNLLDISNKHDGNLIVGNEEHSGREYLCFSFDL